MEKNISCFCLSIVTTIAFLQIDTTLTGSKPVDEKHVCHTDTPLSKKDKPDLIITSVSIRKIITDNKNGQVNRYRVVQYVIKNIGTARADLGKIKIQGFLDNYGDFKMEKMVAACGTSAKQSTLRFINPGVTIKGNYLCAYDRKWNGMKFYLLMVDYDNAIPELNENNNTKVVTINYIN